MIIFEILYIYAYTIHYIQHKIVVLDLFCLTETQSVTKILRHQS